MSDPELDNPIWESLRSRHRGLAQSRDGVARYPAEVAPFLGVARAGMEAGGGLAVLVPPGDTVLLLGAAPAIPPGWQLDDPVPLAQMVCPSPVAVIDGPEIVPLGPPHHDDVLALVALVYPHYFRPRTPDLGRYFGIYRDGQLAAMVGERMGMDAHQEISAVCTHPEHLGRGYARRLLAWLGNDNLSRGRTPFLHVRQDNLRATDLYRKGGYQLRREIPFWALHRPHSPSGA